MAQPAPIFAECERPLSSVLARALFPGRTFVKCDEVAKVFLCTPRHVRNLCAGGTIRGAISVNGDPNETRVGNWRIPVAVYDDWIKRRSNIPELQE